MSSQEWPVNRILAERSRQYLLEWDGIDPDTDKPWEPTWEPKANAPPELVEKWKAQANNWSTSNPSTQESDSSCLVTPHGMQSPSDQIVSLDISNEAVNGDSGIFVLSSQEALSPRTKITAKKTPTKDSEHQEFIPDSQSAEENSLQVVPETLSADSSKEMKTMQQNKPEPPSSTSLEIIEETIPTQSKYLANLTSGLKQKLDKSKRLPNATELQSIIDICRVSASRHPSPSVIPHRTCRDSNPSFRGFAHSPSATTTEVSVEGPVSICPQWIDDHQLPKRRKRSTLQSTPARPSRQAVHSVLASSFPGKDEYTSQLANEPTSTDTQSFAVEQDPPAQESSLQAVNLPTRGQTIPSDSEFDSVKRDREHEQDHPSPKRQKSDHTPEDNPRVKKTGLEAVIELVRLSTFITTKDQTKEELSRYLQDPKTYSGALDNKSHWVFVLRKLDHEMADLVVLDTAEKSYALKRVTLKLLSSLEVSESTNLPSFDSQESQQSQQSQQSQRQSQLLSEIVDIEMPAPGQNSPKNLESSMNTTYFAEALKTQADELQKALTEIESLKSQITVLKKSEKDLQNSKRALTEDFDYIQQQYSNASNAAVERAKECLIAEDKVSRLKTMLSTGMDQRKKFEDAIRSKLDEKVTRLQTEIKFLKIERERIGLESLRQKAALWDEHVARERVLARETLEDEEESEIEEFDEVLALESSVREPSTLESTKSQSIVYRCQWEVEDNACGMVFNTKSSLQTHLEKIHLPIPKLQ